MTKALRVIAMTAVAAVGLPAEAAHQLVQVVRRNSSEVIAYNYYFLRDCSPGPRPQATILRPPANGSVRVISGGGRIAEDNRCRGARSDSVAVLYTPARGFVGQDSFTVQWLSVDGIINNTSTYSFQVR